MVTLAHQQQALLAALLEWPPQPAIAHLNGIVHGVGAQAARGLQVYQANGHLLAERALRTAYPVLAQMLGEASFADLARAFWHASPPVRGDIAQWGAALCEFIRQSNQLQDEAYLPDVARAEWALHRCAFAPDSDADIATLALLTSEDPHNVGLALAPGLVTLSSAWPLSSLLLAHLESHPSMEDLVQQMRDPQPQEVLIWRAGFQPRLRQAMAGELALLGALCAGMALEPALDAAVGLDFAQWLPMAVQTGLVLGAKRLQQPDGDLA
jgi:hypothetical protein